MKQKILFSILSLFLLQMNYASFLPSFKTPTKIETIKHTLTPQSIFEITNTQGSISIKPWKKSELMVEVVKKGSENDIAHTTVTTEYTAKGAKIVTTHTTSKNKCCVDYTILIPHDAIISLAHTNQGNIKIAHCSQPIKIETNRGNIICENNTHNIQAQTQYGTINIAAKNLNEKQTIIAVSKRGNIVFKLPKNTAANIYAQTPRGKITSEHPITLASRTTPINQKTIANLRKDITGFISHKESAIIKAHTSSGNIKLGYLT